MYNDPMTDSVQYGEPPESCSKECEELCKGKTVQELQQISDYFAKEARDLDAKIDSTITKEDFEKVKSREDDSEEEAGEY